MAVPIGTAIFVMEKSVLPSKNAHPLPIVWAVDGSITPARSNAELHALLEEEEIQNLLRIVTAPDDSLE